MRQKAKDFPPIEEPLRVRSARVWHCSYKSLAPLAALTNLETLVIAGYPDASLAPLCALKNLRFLRVIHFPHVTDLSPVAGLKSLVTLSLASLPSWDASGKVLTVASLAPIEHLAALEHLELLGVCPLDRRLPSCAALRHLRSARFSRFPEAQVRAFYEASGVSNSHAPEAIYFAT